MKLALTLWGMWFAAFLFGESVGILTPFQTLSEVFWWLTDTMPPWISLPLNVVASALCFWLGTVHWIHRYSDRPGLDRAELLALALGAISGAIGWQRTRRVRQRGDPR